MDGGGVDGDRNFDSCIRMKRHGVRGPYVRYETLALAGV
jgi:hypothetical protein